MSVAKAASWCGVDEGCGNLVIGNVILVAGKENSELGRGECARVVEECGKCAEGGMGRDVVDENCAGCTTIVRSRDGAEAFGACRIP